MRKAVFSEKELHEREARYRQARAIKYVLQGIRYIMGYLPDYPIHVIPELTSNPIVLTMKIYCGLGDMQVEAMPTFLKEKIARIEEELSNVSKRIPDTQIS